jgi:hypothetical protein
VVSTAKLLVTTLWLVKIDLILQTKDCLSRVVSRTFAAFAPPILAFQHVALPGGRTL